MPPGEFDEKTEQPTIKRLQDARKKGQVARSTDLISAGVLLASATMMMFWGPRLVRSQAELLHSSLDGPAWSSLDTADLSVFLRETLSMLGANVLPFLLVMFLAGVALNLAQFGFLLTTDPLTPQLKRISPLSGAKRIFSVAGLVKLSVSLLKLIIVVILAVWFFWATLPQFAEMLHLSAVGVGGAVGRKMIQLAFLLSTVLFLLALLDFAFQKWKFRKDNMMSKEEVKEELKQMDGDPLVKARQRDAHAKIAAAENVQKTVDADMLTTNPTHISIAIKYDPETMPAPTVIAKGEGWIAMRMREVARENKIPIIERKELARALYRQVRVGDPIPLHMYEVFIEMLSYVYSITGKQPKGLA